MTTEVKSVDATNNDSLSTGAAVSIFVAITLLITLPVGVVIGLGLAWCVWRCGDGPTSECPQQKNQQQLQGAIYEKPQESAIPLRGNQAYDHAVNI